MRKNPRKDIKETIVLAALELAAKRGWEKTTLSAIARKTKISMADLRGIFEDKSDLVAALGRMIDRVVLGKASQPDPESPEKDRIFDVLMDRFEALNVHRAGIVAILNSLRCDPKQFVISLPHLGRSVNWMLESAEIETAGMKGAVRVTAITLIYIKALHTWVGDDSPDLAKVMAMLDKDLNRMDQFAKMIGL